MSRPMWFVGIVKHFFPDRFAIARLTKKNQIFRKFIDWMLFDGDEIYYLIKNNMLSTRQVAYPIHFKQVSDDSSLRHVDDGAEDHDSAFIKPINENVNHDKPLQSKVRLQVNEPLELSTDIALPSDVIRHFLDQSTYIWINYKCICRDASHCTDYPIDLGCIFMGEAVKKINPKLGHLVTKDEAKAHLDRSDDLGLVHMIGRNKIDTVWMGMSPGEKLLSVCHCCECCCLYRVMPDLDETISQKITRMPGVELVTHEDRCNGCGICEDVCFTSAIKIENGVSIRDEKLCVGCGRCVEACPQQAIEMHVDESQYMSETIRRLNTRVDLT